MKMKIIGLAMAVSILLNACEFHGNTNNISIHKQDNNRSLNFTANFPEAKTGAAHHYIEGYLKEERIFRAITDSKKAEIRLADGTQFYLKYEPGFISINLEKGKNSFTSYNRMKKMASGFAKILKD